MPDTPQFDIPFRLDSFTGQPAELEQDEIEEVTDSVETLLRTQLGSLEENPDYGVFDPTFEEGEPDMEDIQSAIGQWEDRADDLIEQKPDYLDHLIQNVYMTVSGRTTDA